MKRLILLLLLSCSATAGNLGEQANLLGSEYSVFHSEVVDRDYHIYVKVPFQAEEHKTQQLPVVYLLDGGNTFPMFVPYVKYLNWAKEVPPVILVGISYGTDDWQQGNKRSTDYTLPAESRDHYGGAEKFHQFLSQELIPMIEEKYPVDSSQRMLFGHSLGGQFALFSAMFQPQTFSGIVASNPAIHRNPEKFLASVATSNYRPKLFVMQADNDDERYEVPRKKWLEYWQNKPHHWQEKVMTAQGHSHMSSLPAAFRQGMMWLLQNQSNE